jgi:hypothetical protein
MLHTIDNQLGLFLGDNNNGSIKLYLFNHNDISQSIKEIINSTYQNLLQLFQKLRQTPHQDIARQNIINDIDSQSQIILDYLPLAMQDKDAGSLTEPFNSCQDIPFIL